MKRWRKIIVVFLVLFGVWSFLAPFLAWALIVEKPLQRADAIWVLSGSSTYIERNREAARAYHNGVARKIFLTNDGGYAGWSTEEQRNPSFVELAQRELINQGVPAAAVEILPGQVEGTNYEADLFAETVRQREFKSVLLVTSAYHTRRTLWTFNRAVLKNNLSVEIGLQSPPTGEQTPSPYFWWFSYNGWKMVGEEIVKNFAYWVYY